MGYMITNTKESNDVEINQQYKYSFVSPNKNSNSFIDDNNSYIINSTIPKKMVMKLLQKKDENRSYKHILYNKLRTNKQTNINLHRQRSVKVINFNNNIRRKILDINNNINHYLKNSCLNVTQIKNSKNKNHQIIKNDTDISNMDKKEIINKSILKIRDNSLIENNKIKTITKTISIPKMKVNNDQNIYTRNRNNSMNTVKYQNMKTVKKPKKKTNKEIITKTNSIFLEKNNKKYTNFIKNSSQKYIKYRNISKITKERPNSMKSIKEKDYNDKNNEIRNLKQNPIDNPGTNRTIVSSELKDKIKENFSKNTIVLYTIYIISKYDEKCDKIGIKLIKLYDINKNEIDILFSNANENLFNDNNNPFICEFHSDFFINFYLNNVLSKKFKYIKIVNYSDIDNNISAIKEIEIYKEQQIIYKGILNSHYENLINIINTNYKENSHHKKEAKHLSSCHRARSNIYRNNSYVSYKTPENSIKKNIKSKRRVCNKNNSFFIQSSKRASRSNSSSRNKSKNQINNIFLKQEKNNNRNNNFIFVINNNTNNNINKNKINCYLKDITIIEKNAKKYLLNKNNPKKFHFINEKYLKENNNNAINKNNYIEFNKIRFEFCENYGHKQYIGLTGIQFYDMKNKLINIENARSIAAIPKDLKTLYNDLYENRIFENIFNGFNNTDDSENMWVSLYNREPDKQNTFIELYFENKIRVSKIKIYNYNEKNKLDICTKKINLFLDDTFYDNIYLDIGTGEIAYDSTFEGKIDFGKEIIFPINKIENNDKINNLKIIFASQIYKQCYETPYLPGGKIIKFQFVSNYYLNKNNSFEKGLIGLDKINIYDENNSELITLNNFIANSEIIKDYKNKIILNGLQNEKNSCIFYLFDKFVNISYIKFFPLTKCGKYIYNTVKEIKIFCDEKIIFEGILYDTKPTIILFTSDKKILNDIDESYLTLEFNIRNYKEKINKDYNSLILS